jgi:hypothetical protein
MLKNWFFNSRHATVLIDIRTDATPIKGIKGVRPIN